MLKLKLERIEEAKEYDMALSEEDPPSKEREEGVIRNLFRNYDNRKVCLGMSVRSYDDRKVCLGNYDNRKAYIYLGCMMNYRKVYLFI